MLPEAVLRTNQIAEFVTVTAWKKINIIMLFAGREVRIGKNCARGLEYVLKTEGTVFPNTDRPRPANNVFIFFFRRVLCKQFSC